MERAEKPIGFGRDSVGILVEEGQKPIGFENDPETIETIPVLVSAPKPPSPPDARPPAIELPEPQFDEEEGDLDAVRVRDDDLDPALYDFDKGDWLPQPVRPDQQQQAARAWVATACAAATRP